MEDGQLRYGMFQSEGLNLGLIGAEKAQFHPFNAPCGHDLLSDPDKVWACEYCEDCSGINDDIGVGLDIFFGAGIGGHMGFDLNKFFDNFKKIGSYSEPEEPKYGAIDFTF